jgi:hypothetical protein
MRLTIVMLWLHAHDRRGAMLVRSSELRQGRGAGRTERPLPGINTDPGGEPRVRQKARRVIATGPFASQGKEFNQSLSKSSVI